MRVLYVFNPSNFIGTGKSEALPQIQPRHLSLISALAGATFWGLSGTAAQPLFQKFGFPVLGLVMLRLLVGGGVLLVLQRPLRPTRPYLPLFTLSIFGFVGSQLFYLLAIQFSNAATATLLQFLFLPMVAGYEAITREIRLSAKWALTLVLAIIGTILLIGGFTNFSFHVLVTPLGLLFGLLSAVSGAFYTVKSRSVVRAQGPWFVTTWGFVIGGCAMIPLGVLSLWKYSLPSGLATQASIISLVGVVIVFGTILGYGLYLSGLRRLSATEVGVAASTEPISAALASYLFLNVVLTYSQYLGGGLILIAVVLLGTQLGRDSRVRSTITEKK